MGWQRLGGVAAAAVVVVLLAMLWTRPPAGKKKRTKVTHTHGGDAHTHEGGETDIRTPGGTAVSQAHEQEAAAHVDTESTPTAAVGQQVEVALRGADLGVAVLAGCDGESTARLVGVLGGIGQWPSAATRREGCWAPWQTVRPLVQIATLSGGGGLPLVLQALKDEDKGVQSKALWAVGNLALSPDSHDTLAEAIPQLVDTLRAGPGPGRASDDRAMALRALVNLAGSGSTHAAMRREGLLPLLVGCMDGQGSESLLGLRLVANLSLEEGNALPLVQAGLLPRLKELLGLDDEQWLVRALLVATNVLTHMHGEVGPASLQDGPWLVERCGQLQAAGGDEVREKATALAAALQPYVAK